MFLGRLYWISSMCINIQLSTGLLKSLLWVLISRSGTSMLMSSMLLSYLF